MDKIILVDFDDVTGDLMTAWLGLYNRDHDDCVIESDIKSWAIANYVKCGEGIYDYLKYPSLYDNVFPIVGAENGINYLRDLGFRIVFITASTPEQAGRKYTWLGDYGLIDSRKNYVEALDKSIILGDYLIDDNPENVINAYGQGIVYTKEWNKSLGGYVRMNDWSDITNYFRKIKNETGD